MSHQVDVTVADVSVEDYLVNRRALAHLVELAPHLQPAAFQLDADEASLAQACDAMRAKGVPQPDVRLLVDDGERHLALADALARALHCDVYLTPEGAHVRFVRESSVVGSLWDAIATDRETGEPAQWLVVRPADLPAQVPTWFTTVRGRLRQSSGLATVALPDGLAFATRNRFRDAVYLAGHVRKNSGQITTVAVNADLGRFEISRFAKAGSLLSGVEFATLVAASLDVIHPDVQLALTWPTDKTACAALDVEIMRFADALNRTVWVPQQQGAAFVLSGCGEFVAVDEVGAPSAWRPYPARLAAESLESEPLASPPVLRTDLDGRLVPLSEPVTTAFTAVPFVSIPARQLDNQRAWYESMTPVNGLFVIDLGVVSDGRLGVLLADGSPLAVGPRALRAMLRDAGWSNEDLVLLAQTPGACWDEANRHLRSLTETLTVNIWLPAPDADVWAPLQGGLAAHQPDGTGEAWRVVAYGRSADLDGGVPDGVARPAALTGGPRPDDRPRRQGLLASAELARMVPLEPDIQPSTELVAVEAREHGLDSLALDEDLRHDLLRDDLRDDRSLDDRLRHDQALEGQALEGRPLEGQVLDDQGDGEIAVLSDPIEAVAVTLARVQGAAGPHAVPWLPPTPVVNRRAIDLYLWTPLANDEIEAWGLPSADLFLLAGQDPLRLADRRRDGYLLRVEAPEETAVDLLEHVRHAPAVVRQRLLDTGCTHLLPLAWLSDLRVTARYDLDGRGGVASRDDIAVGALAIRFEGAEHGVPGLPNEVVHWPDKAQRANAPSYLMLPDEPVADGQVVHRGYVPLSRRKPTLADGHRLLEVKVPKRRAIDVPATLDSLGGLPVVGRMHDFVGLDLLLPADDLPNALVSRIWRHGPTGKPVVERLTGESLSTALAPPALTPVG